MKAAGLLLLVLLSLSQASPYYADIDIQISQSGAARIEGTTNHPTLLSDFTEDYTSKEKSHWLLNITHPEQFSDFVYSVSLPQGASINYVKSSGSFRIEQHDGSLQVVGFGRESPLSIAIQYAVAPNSGFDFSLLFIPAAFALLATALFILKKRPSPPKYDLGLLSPRQRKIMEFLIKNGKPATQAMLERELGLPKASLSRNLASLELKGLLEREKAGMANMVRLRKK